MLNPSCFLRTAFYSEPFKSFENRFSELRIVLIVSSCRSQVVSARQVKTEKIKVLQRFLATYLRSFRLLSFRTLSCIFMEISLVAVASRRASETSRETTQSQVIAGIS